MKPNSLTTVASNVDTFGKPSKAHWSYDEALSPRGPQPDGYVPMQQRDRSTKSMTNWIPAAKQQGYRAAGLRVHANKVGVGQDVKRIPFTIVNEETGELEKRFSKLVKNSVCISFGKCDVVFTKTNRGLTFCDSRTPKIRRSKDFVLSELCRMIGEKAGTLAMEHLLAL